MKPEMKIGSKYLVFRAPSSVFSFSVLSNYLCSLWGSSTYSKEQNSIIICLTFFTEIFLRTTHENMSTFQNLSGELGNLFYSNYVINDLLVSVDRNWNDRTSGS